MQAIKKSHIKLSTVFLASLASGLEYYDFLIYAYMLPFFSFVIFASGKLAWREGMLWFAIGCLLRPLGAFFWGFVADVVGRRASLLAIMYSLGASIIIMALLPGYASIGIACPIIFVLLRMLQSVSFGADLPCGIVFLYEHAPPGKSGRYAGIMAANVGIGAALAALAGTLLTSIFSQQAMLWAWRLAFLFGGVLALIAVFTRRKLAESPEFMVHRNHVTRVSFKTLIYGAGVLLLPASLVMLNTSFPTLLHFKYHYATKLIYKQMMIVSFMSALLIYCAGYWSDKFGREFVLKIACLITGTCIGPAFLLLIPLHTALALFAFLLLYHAALALLAGVFFVHLAEIFPVRQRARSYALCYNVVYAALAVVPFAVLHVNNVADLLCVALPLLSVLAWYCAKQNYARSYSSLHFSRA